MHISRLYEALKSVHSAGLVPFIWGPAGIGKSRVVAQFLNDHCPNGWSDFRVATCDPVDLRGMPRVTEEGTTWAPPTSFPFSKGRGVFFDEANQGSRAVLAALYQIVYDRAAGDHKFADDAIMILAGNDIQSSNVVTEMPQPLKNRLVHLEIETSIEDWTEWALKNEIDTKVLAFLRFRPSLLNELESSEIDADAADRVAKGKKARNNSRDMKGFGTPRSWEMVSKVVKNRPDPGIRFNLIAGCVGNGCAHEFTAYEEVFSKLPDFNLIFRDPLNAPVPKEIGQLYAIATGIPEHANESRHEAIFKYAERLPKEFNVMMIVDCIRRDAFITSTDAFAAWASVNHEVLISA